MEKRPLATLPVPSTSFTTDPTFVHPGGEAELRVEFERDGATVRGGIRFEKVRAFRFRGESHCTAWHVQGAYDTLVEVSPSDWAAESVPVIRQHGLRPMSRQYVHLSCDVETAREVGRRKDPHPVILAVDAAGAHDAGVAFYEGNELVWLADAVPATFLAVAELE